MKYQSPFSLDNSNDSSSQQSANASNGFDALLEKGEALRTIMKNSEKTLLDDHVLDRFLSPLPQGRQELHKKHPDFSRNSTPASNNFLSRAAIEHETVGLRIDDPELFGFIDSHFQEDSQKRELRELDKGRFMIRSFKVETPKIQGLVSGQRVFLEVETPSFGSRAVSFDVLKIYSKGEITKDGMIEFMKEIVLDLDFSSPSGSLEEFVNSGVVLKVFVERLVDAERHSGSATHGKRPVSGAGTMTNMLLAFGRLSLAQVVQAPGYSGTFRVPLATKIPSFDPKSNKNIPSRDPSAERKKGPTRMTVHASQSKEGGLLKETTETHRAGFIIVEACLESSSTQKKTQDKNQKDTEWTEPRPIQQAENLMVLDEDFENAQLLMALYIERGLNFTKKANSEVYISYKVYGTNERITTKVSKPQKNSLIFDHKSTTVLTPQAVYQMCGVPIVLEVWDRGGSEGSKDDLIGLVKLPLHSVSSAFIDQESGAKINYGWLKTSVTPILVHDDFVNVVGLSNGMEMGKLQVQLAIGTGAQIAKFDEMLKSKSGKIEKEDPIASGPSEDNNNPVLGLNQLLDENTRKIHQNLLSSGVIQNKSPSESEVKSQPIELHLQKEPVPIKMQVPEGVKRTQEKPNDPKEQNENRPVSLEKLDVLNCIQTVLERIHFERPRTSGALKKLTSETLMKGVLNIHQKEFIKFLLSLNIGDQNEIRESGEMLCRLLDQDSTGFVSIEGFGQTLAAYETLASCLVEDNKKALLSASESLRRKGILPSALEQQISSLFDIRAGYIREESLRKFWEKKEIGSSEQCDRLIGAFDDGGDASSLIYVPFLIEGLLAAQSGFSSGFSPVYLSHLDGPRGFRLMVERLRAARSRENTREMRENISRYFEELFEAQGGRGIMVTLFEVQTLVSKLLGSPFSIYETALLTKKILSNRAKGDGIGFYSVNPTLLVGSRVLLVRVAEFFEAIYPETNRRTEEEFEEMRMSQGIDDSQNDERELDEISSLLNQKKSGVLKPPSPERTKPVLMNRGVSPINTGNEFGGSFKGPGFEEVEANQEETKPIPSGNNSRLPEFKKDSTMRRFESPKIIVSPPQEKEVGRLDENDDQEANESSVYSPIKYENEERLNPKKKNQRENSTDKSQTRETGLISGFLHKFTVTIDSLDGLDHEVLESGLSYSETADQVEKRSRTANGEPEMLRRDQKFSSAKIPGDSAQNKKALKDFPLLVKYMFPANDHLIESRPFKCKTDKKMVVDLRSEHSFTLSKSKDVIEFLKSSKTRGLYIRVSQKREHEEKVLGHVVVPMEDFLVQKDPKSYLVYASEARKEIVIGRLNISIFYEKVGVRGDQVQMGKEVAMRRYLPKSGRLSMKLDSISDIKYKEDYKDTICSEFGPKTGQFRASFIFSVKLFPDFIEEKPKRKSKSQPKSPEKDARVDSQEVHFVEIASGVCQEAEDLEAFFRAVKEGVRVSQTVSKELELTQSVLEYLQRGHASIDLLLKCCIDSSDKTIIQPIGGGLCAYSGLFQNPGAFSFQAVLGVLAGGQSQGKVTLEVSYGERTKKAEENKTQTHLFYENSKEDATLKEMKDPRSIENPFKRVFHVFVLPIVYASKEDSEPVLKISGEVAGEQQSTEYFSASQNPESFFGERATMSKARGHELFEMVSKENQSLNRGSNSVGRSIALARLADRKLKNLMRFQSNSAKDFKVNLNLVQKTQGVNPEGFQEVVAFGEIDLTNLVLNSQILESKGFRSQETVEFVSDCLSVPFICSSTGKTLQRRLLLDVFILRGSRDNPITTKRLNDFLLSFEQLLVHSYRPSSGSSVIETYQSRIHKRDPSPGLAENEKNASIFLKETQAKPLSKTLGVSESESIFIIETLGGAEKHGVPLESLKPHSKLKFFHISPEETLAFLKDFEFFDFESNGFISEAEAIKILKPFFEVSSIKTLLSREKEESILNFFKTCKSSSQFKGIQPRSFDYLLFTAVSLVLNGDSSEDRLPSKSPVHERLRGREMMGRVVSVRILRGVGLGLLMPNNRPPSSHIEGILRVQGEKEDIIFKSGIQKRQCAPEWALAFDVNTLSPLMDEFHISGEILHSEYQFETRTKLTHEEVIGRFDYKFHLNDQASLIRVPIFGKDKRLAALNSSDQCFIELECVVEPEEKGPGAPMENRRSPFLSSEFRMAQERRESIGRPIGHLRQKSREGAQVNRSENPREEDEKQEMENEKEEEVLARALDTLKEIRGSNFRVSDSVGPETLGHLGILGNTFGQESISGGFEEVNKSIEATMMSISNAFKRDRSPFQDSLSSSLPLNPFLDQRLDKTGEQVAPSVPFTGHEELNENSHKGENVENKRKLEEDDGSLEDRFKEKQVKEPAFGRKLGTNEPLSEIKEEIREIQNEQEKMEDDSLNVSKSSSSPSEKSKKKDKNAKEIERLRRIEAKINSAGFGDKSSEEVKRISSIMNIKAPHDKVQSESSSDFN